MLIPFKKEHVDCMSLRQHEAMLITPQALANLEDASIAMTGILDGRIIACGGVIMNQYGTCDIWLLPSTYASSVNIRFARTIKKWLDEVQKEHGIVRMQTNCLNDELHSKWMSFLGFEREGLLRKYINGLDYTAWGKLWA